MPMRAGQQSRQRNPGGISHNVMFAPRFAPIRGIGTGFFPHRPRRANCGYRPAPETSRSYRLPGAWPVTADGAGATRRCGASHANVASMSCQSRSPSPGGASPTGDRPSAQRGYRSARCGRVPVADHLWVWGAQAARGAPRAPRVRRVQEVLPCTHDTRK
jgi:hypothetical protein